MTTVTGLPFSRQSYQSHVQEQNFEDETIRSSGEGVVSEHVQIAAKG